jgi:hypothetical protein
MFNIQFLSNMHRFKVIPVLRIFDDGVMLISSAMGRNEV